MRLRGRAKYRRQRFGGVTARRGVGSRKLLGKQPAALVRKVPQHVDRQRPHPLAGADRHLDDRGEHGTEIEVEPAEPVQRRFASVGRRTLQSSREFSRMARQNGWTIASRLKIAGDMVVRRIVTANDHRDHVGDRFRTLQVAQPGLQLKPPVGTRGVVIERPAVSRQQPAQDHQVAKPRTQPRVRFNLCLRVLDLRHLPCHFA